MRWPHLTKTLWNSLGRKDMQTLTYWWTLGRCYHHPITIKPNIASDTAEQFSWVPSPCCSPPGGPFPIKSIALSAHVSPQTIHFQVLDKSPLLGPRRGASRFLWHIECSTFTASSFRIWNSSAGIPSPPLALFIVILPKAHLTLHSRMSGSWWVIAPLWLSGSLRSFL